MQSPMHDDQKETMAAADPLDFLQCPETLHPDLQRHFRDGPVGKMLHHPFIINVMTLPGHHKADNMMYLHRKEEAERSWHQKNWSRYIALHERPYRAEALQRVLFEGGLPFDQPATWRLIKAVWIDSENVDEHEQFWSATWNKAKSELTLDIEEKVAFDELPDMVPVWHGLEREDSSTLGLSWTTDKGVAAWFAQRFARLNRRPAYIAAGLVHKEHVKAFLLSRGEHEIIAFPDKVDQVAVMPCASKGVHPSGS